jgi:kinetochore protein Spc7/SPC105
MAYKNQLQLFFHPAAFAIPSQQARKSRPNAPISLSYTARNPHNDQPKELGTTTRFFLQLLRANLQALPQCETSVKDMLNFISSGWESATAVAEAERRLSLEALTTSRIVSDERLAIESSLLLSRTRTKVRVVFELAAAVGDGEQGLELGTTVDVKADVIYGEALNAAKMTRCVVESVASVADGWAEGVRELRGRLVAGGAKGFRK